MAAVVVVEDGEQEATSCEEGDSWSYLHPDPEGSCQGGEDAGSKVSGCREREGGCWQGM